MKENVQRKFEIAQRKYEALKETTSVTVTPRSVTDQGSHRVPRKVRPKKKETKQQEVQKESLARRMVMFLLKKSGIAPVTDAEMALQRQMAELAGMKLMDIN